MIVNFQEKNNEILSYNNELTHLQTRLEEAQGQVVKWYAYKPRVNVAIQPLAE